MEEACMRRVLVTGAAGYIGSVLVRQLLDKGYLVRGIDLLNFGGESLIGVYNHHNFEFIKGDIRKKSDILSTLKDIDSIIHLAAIVGDPACAQQPDVAKQTNLDASKMLIDLCNESKNIERFVFASTCSNYGKMDDKSYLDENSPLSPISLYAELKVKLEKYILQDGLRNDLCATILRFATAYGLSPRMRFDLTVNEFIKEVTLGRELLVYGEKFWRPYCHVEDIARACISVLEYDKYKIHQNVFGVGDTDENYQKKTLTELITSKVQSAKITYVKKDEDPRDYKVNFSKIKNILGFQVSKKVPDGIEEIHFVLVNKFLTDPDAKQYKNA
jgi:nucleoside-diphosphate-sugar epimerase